MIASIMLFMTKLNRDPIMTKLGYNSVMIHLKYIQPYQSTFWARQL